MPDAFESAYPLSPTVNPEDIRARANSSSKKKRPVVAFLADDEAVEIPDKSEVGVSKPLARSDKSEVELDSFAESLSTMHSTWFDKRVLEHRFVYRWFIFIRLNYFVAQIKSFRLSQALLLKLYCIFIVVTV